MVKRWIVLVFMVGLVLPSITGAVSPDRSDGYSPQGTVDVWLDPFDIYTLYWLSLDAGDTIYVNIQVTSGGSIDFFICDGENYDLYTSLETAYVYSQSENQGSISLSFNVPSSGEWHVVFENDALTVPKHIEGWVGLIQDPSISLTGVAIFIILISAICLIGVILKVHSDNKKKKLPSRSQGTSAQPVVPSTGAAFCPSCGAQRQSTQSMFCANCGRAFSGPEFE